MLMSTFYMHRCVSVNHVKGLTEAVFRFILRCSFSLLSIGCWSRSLNRRVPLTGGATRWPSSCSLQPYYRLWSSTVTFSTVLSPAWMYALLSSAPSTGRCAQRSDILGFWLWCYQAVYSKVDMICFTGNNLSVLSTVVFCFFWSAGVSNNKCCQALFYSGRGGQPDVCGCTKVHGPDHLPEHVVVCSSPDYSGTLFPLAGTFTSCTFILSVV